MSASPCEPRSRLWLALLLVAAAAAPAAAQPSARSRPARSDATVPSLAAPQSEVHPLLASLRGPAWLAERSGLTLLRAPALEVRAEGAWGAALRAVLAPQIAAGASRDALRAVVAAEPSSAALVAATRAAGHDAGVRLELSRRGQRVTLRAHFLDLRAQPPAEHASEASASLDAFLAQVVGGVPAVRASTVRARSVRFDAAGLLGLGVADLDGDGRDELIVARAPYVSVYALDAEGARLRLTRRARAPWPAAPRRVPFVRRAEAWLFVEDGRVVIGRSDREGEFALALRGGELDLESVASRCAGGRLFDDGCARWVPGRDYFAGQLGAEGAAPPGRDADASHDEGGEDDPDAADQDAADDPQGATVVGGRPPRFYTRVRRSVVQADGRALPFVALVTPRGALVAQVGDRRGAAAGQGASLAAADIDSDGALDVLTSDYVRDGQEDRLRWFRVTPDGRLGLLWEGARVPGAVLHAAAGDLLGTGRPLFVAFEGRTRGGSRLWVVE